jgi:hypothetical protein
MAVTAPDYRVRVSVLPTSEGGRSQPIHSGYRPMVWAGGKAADGSRLYHDALLEWEGVDSVGPGHTGVARLKPAVPANWLDVRPGSTIRLCEGPHVVALADVIDVVAAAKTARAAG